MNPNFITKYQISVIISESENSTLDRIFETNICNKAFSNSFDFSQRRFLSANCLLQIALFIQKRGKSLWLESSWVAEISKGPHMDLKMALVSLNILSSVCFANSH